MNLNRRRNWFDHAMTWLDTSWQGKIIAIIVSVGLMLFAGKVILAFFTE